MMNRFAPYARSLLRIVAGLLFVEHGTVKLFMFPVAGAFHHPLPRLLLAAGLIETVCGSLLTLGIATRLAAFLMSGEMAIAYFEAHAPRGFYPIANGGEAAVPYCFIFLYLACAGGGPIGLGRPLSRRFRLLAA